MIALMARSLDLPPGDTILQRVLDREAISSTGVDEGVGIPHARLEEIDCVVAGLGISRAGLDYESPDGQPVHLVFLILASTTATPAYLSVLGRTARIFNRKEIRQKVLDATSAVEIISLIEQQEPV
jgi:mannitol/fructose-specific phosphotransferase system IIA component (Ntr-type)